MGLKILEQNAIAPFDEEIVGRLVFFNDLERAVFEEDAPVVFLETGDYETVKKSMITLLKYHKSIEINEWYFGIGKRKISDSQPQKQLSANYLDGLLSENGMPEIDKIDDFFSDNSTHIRELYNLLFSLDEKWNILVIKEFDTLQKDCNFGAYIAGWLRYFAILQMNRKDPKKNKSVIIVSKYAEIPQQLLPCAKKIIVEPPGSEELKRFVVPFIEKQLAAPEDVERLKNEIISHLSGFSRTEISTILKTVDASAQNSLERACRNIKTEKEKSIKRISALKLCHLQKTQELGGLEKLSKHLENVSLFLRKKEMFQRYGLKTPRGILLVGMPGCGKSLAAKNAALILDRPLLQLEFGKILGKHVGESETNFLAALDSAEKSAPCVLWIDELEKAFAGMDDSTGVTKRLFGSFLTWMQESNADVYIIATANNISQLPPEFKRRGRFDKIFSLQMPTQFEREKIFKLKLKNLGSFASSVRDNCHEYARLTRFEYMLNADDKKRNQAPRF